MIEMWEVGKWNKDWNVSIRSINVLKVTEDKVYYGKSLKVGDYDVLYKDSETYRIVESFDKAKKLAIKWQTKKVKAINKQRKVAVKELERFESLTPEEV